MALCKSRRRSGFCATNTVPPNFNFANPQNVSFGYSIDRQTFTILDTILHFSTGVLLSSYEEIIEKPSMNVI